MKDCDYIVKNARSEIVNLLVRLNSLDSQLSVHSGCEFYRAISHIERALAIINNQCEFIDLAKKNEL